MGPPIPAPGFKKKKRMLLCIAHIYIFNLYKILYNNTLILNSQLGEVDSPEVLAAPGPRGGVDDVLLVGRQHDGQTPAIIYISDTVIFYLKFPSSYK